MIMWCEEQKNGKVKYVERFMDPITNKSSKVSVTMDKDTNVNRKRAQIALQAKIDEKLKDLFTPVRKENLTLSEFAELYLSYQEQNLKKSTYTRNKFAIRKIVGYLGGESLVDNLNAQYVKNNLYVGADKPGTKNERLTRFKALIRWGYQEEFIKNVAWLDKLKPFEDEEKKRKLEEKYLESEELKLVLDNMKIDKWKFIAEFAALSGMRIGEIIALESSDLDFKNRTITVSKTYDSNNRITTTPKTGYSVREIFMQDQLYTLCKKIKIYMTQEQVHCAYRTNLFISDEDGDPINYFSYNKHLGDVTLRVVGKKATSHFMRHTHVALMAEQGVPLDVISRRLGHSDSDITKEIYFHVTEKLRQKDYDRIKNIKII